MHSISKHLLLLASLATAPGYSIQCGCFPFLSAFFRDAPYYLLLPLCPMELSTSSHSVFTSTGEGIVVFVLLFPMYMPSISVLFRFGTYSILASGTFSTRLGPFDHLLMTLSSFSTPALFVYNSLRRASGARKFARLFACRTTILSALYVWPAAPIGQQRSSASTLLGI